MWVFFETQCISVQNAHTILFINFRTFILVTNDHLFLVGLAPNSSTLDDVKRQITHFIAEKCVFRSPPQKFE